MTVTSLRCDSFHVHFVKTDSHKRRSTLRRLKGNFPRVLAYGVLTGQVRYTDLRGFALSHAILLAMQSVWADCYSQKATPKGN